MKNIFLLILLCAGTNSFAQYFQRYFNEVVVSPPKRTEAFDDGLKSRVNYDSLKSKYYFVGTGYSELSPAATSGTDARLRFIHTTRAGLVNVNNAYQFADVSPAWFESRGKDLCEVDNGAGTGGYVVVGAVNNNPATGSTNIPGGTDMLFSMFNNKGTPTLRERIDVAEGADVATGVVRSSFVKNTYLVCGYSVKATTVNAVVARISSTGAVVWLRSINMVAAVQCNSTSKAFAYSLCEDPRSGNVYVCGKVSGHKTATDVDGLVFAVTATGGLLWQVYHNLGEATDEYHDIKFTSSGTLLVCGFSNVSVAGAGPFYDTWLTMFNPAVMPGAGGLVWSFKHHFADPSLQTKGYRVIEGKTGTEGAKRYYVVGPVYPTSGPPNQMMLEVFNNGLGGGSYHVYPPPYGPLGFDSRFGLDSIEMKFGSPGLIIFSSTVQPPTGTQSNSYLLKTYYNGATCKDLCNQYADNPMQMPAHLAMEACKDTVYRVRKLVYIRYPYVDALICTQKTIACGKNTRQIAGIADIGQGTILGEMMLAPNPATNSLNISIANAKVGAYHLEISDMQGRIVLSSVIQLNGAGTRVDIAGLKQGYYVVKLGDGASQWSTPFMKQ